MKIWKKLSIFVILSLVLCMALATVCFATEASSEAPAETGVKLDKDMSGENMTLGERFEYALQGTATGMLMVFAVLALLWGIVSLSKVIFYDIPNKKKEKEKKQSKAPVEAKTSAEAPATVAEPTPVAEAADDGELAAVITAAIAAMIESGDYKNEFVGGFRVVSFKRTTSGAWNRK